MLINFFNMAGNRSAIERRRRFCDFCPVLLSSDFRQFGYDYFDNPDAGRGYGGYRYDQRWKVPARLITSFYQLHRGDKVLEVGCAKGYLLEALWAVAWLNVYGVERSWYALQNTHTSVRGMVVLGDICALPFPSNTFELVISKEVLPHIPKDDIPKAVSELVRVGNGNVFVEIQCPKDERGKELMREWDPTHKTIEYPDWWDGVLPASMDRWYKMIF